MVIQNIIWIAKQPFINSGFNCLVSVALIALLLAAAMSDIYCGRFVRGSRLVALFLPLVGTFTILVTGAVFERKPTLVFLPYAELVLCLVLSAITVSRCRAMWRTAAALSLCFLWLSVWYGFVSIMSVSGDWL